VLNALITGVNGFCARHLTHRLIEEGGIRVIGLDVQTKSPIETSLDDYLQVDILNLDRLSTVIRKTQPDFVFHLAGLVNGTSANVYQTNFMGAVYLLESIHRHKSDANVLLVGSAAEYGFVDKSDLPVTEDRQCRPVGSYGISKYAATLAAHDYFQSLKMKIVVGRPFNIIGAGVPQGLVVGDLLSRAKEVLQTQANPIVRVGNLDSKRDFVAVDDVAEAYLQMIRGDFWGEVFNICSGNAYSIRKIVEMLLSNSERQISLEVDPNLVRSSEVNIVYGSNEKAQRLFGFDPNTDLDNALKSAWEYEIKRID